MIVMAMLAFFVFVSRYYVTCRNRQFEQSRWMIVVALLLFVVHYMCQMRLGWRQQGNDVGVLFNLLFYSPSAILLSWSQLNILRAGHRRWSFMRYGVVGYALMVLCIVAGVISNGSLHIGPMLYVADAIHFFTLLYYTWAPLRELGNVQRRLDSEHGNPADAYLRTMRFGFFVVCAFAVISPLYILSRPLLFVFGPLGLISLSLFIVSFTALGFSMSEGVTEIVTETNDEIAAAKVFREIGPERIAEIDMAVSKWRSEGGFRDSNLTLSSFARRIMVNRTDVASYLTSIYGKNFRTWLSGIRVEEAKALMAAHPEYSNEVVSNTKEKKWESKWTRSDVSSVSMIPAVSIKSEMVFVCGWNDASGWEVTGLDWKSGATRHRSILGKNNRANGAYAIIQYLANGDLLFNSVAGPIRVKY